MTREPLRLGISGSSFVYAMPKEIVLAAYMHTREGRAVPFDDRMNRLMVEFMREMMGAVNDSPVQSMECYHALGWESGPIIDLMLESPNVEFWSVHSPYGRFFNASSPVDEEREGALAGFLDTVDVARRLGAKLIVAHPGADIPYDVPRNIQVNNTAQTIKRVAEVAGEHGIRVGVEPMPKREIGNSLDEVLTIVDKINLPNVGVNFDVNHVFPPEAIPDLIRKAGSRIVNVHISDQDGVERHWLPFEGKLDWPAVLQALTDAGYTGPLIYETHIKDATSCREVVDRVVENYGRLSSLSLIGRGLG